MVFIFCLIPPEGSDVERKLAGIHHETRIHILNLLITSLERNPPNLALYLLGFELKKPVSTTNLQDPGRAPQAQKAFVASYIEVLTRSLTDYGLFWAISLKKMFGL